MIANNNGSVAIIEGQGGGYITQDSATAKTRYDPGGNNTIGFAQLPDKFK